MKNRLYRTLKELSGIRKLLCIIAILIVAAFLVKPVYTLVEEVISRVRMFFEEEIFTRTHFSEEERKKREIEYMQTSVDEVLYETEWESEEMKEDTKQKMLEMLEMKD